MRLYLVRHAVAEELAETQAGNDASRALTPEGVDKMRLHVRALENLDVRLNRIWTSPLLRARQTGEILAEFFKPREGVKVVEALSPEGDYVDLLTKLASLDEGTELALVGHEPCLSELTTLLLTGSQRGGVEFKKGGMACIRVEGRPHSVHGTLLWLLPPRILRRLAH